MRPGWHFQCSQQAEAASPHSGLREGEATEAGRGEAARAQEAVARGCSGRVGACVPD